MNRIIKFIEQLIFWIKYSGYLKCKHCCINCQFYNSCKWELENEIDFIENKIDFRDF